MMTSVPQREGQTFGGPSRLAVYASFVKLPHTVFALPFALVGVVLASYRHPLTAGVVGWTVLAFTAARFAAMGFNRIVDREFDAGNPRTRGREIPRGALGVGEAWLAVAVASLVFLAAAAMLNPMTFALAPVALAWIFFYSYTKRFTRYAHLVLGLGMAIAPVGGYLAVTGGWSRPWWLLVVLALAVTTWGAGFDVLYALADIEFDRAQGLHSIPAALGERGAIAVARGLHLLTALCLLLLGAAAFPAGAPGAAWSWSGIGVVAAMLVYEHSLVRPGDLRRLDAAFFTMNGVISLALFAFVLAGRLVAGGDVAARVVR